MKAWKKIASEQVVHNKWVNEVLYELPGGMIEEGEDPLETAKRELSKKQDILAEIGNKSCAVMIIRQRIRIVSIFS